MRFGVRRVSIILLHLVAFSMGVQYLHSDSPQSEKVFFRSHDGSSWVVPKARKDENRLQALRDPESTFRVLIVDRDSMSSDLLATALTRDRNCQASAVRSADLMDSVVNGKAQLVVIGADLNHDTKTGFDLAHTVRRAHPAVPIVMLLKQSTHDSVINAFRSGARGVPDAPDMLGPLELACINIPEQLANEANIKRLKRVFESVELLRDAKV